MTYNQSLHYLNSSINYEHMTGPSPKRVWNLARMRRLLEIFDHPEKAFIPILIAGTKGKGSTGFFLESIMEASGTRSGFYSSPHLLDVRERIRIRGQIISRKDWTAVFQTIERTLNRKKWPRQIGQPTYFEMMTLAAMLAFKRAGISIGIFEVGLGGRLDATNVMDAPLVILTPIHYDHEALLGSTLTKIAAEKAAIIRKNAWVVVSPQVPEARKVIVQTAARLKAHLLPVHPFKTNRTLLRGDFQRMNAAAALEASKWLHKHYGVLMTPRSIRNGLKNQKWRGRFEILNRKPAFVLDVAHNPASAEAFLRNFQKAFTRNKKVLIFGVSKDKNSEKMLRAFSRQFRVIILAVSTNPRAQNIDTLIAQCSNKFDSIFPAESYSKAIELAKTLAGAKGVVAVTGSFYLVGEIMRRMNHE